MGPTAVLVSLGPTGSVCTATGPHPVTVGVLGVWLRQEDQRTEGRDPATAPTGRSSHRLESCLAR